MEPETQIEQPKKFEEFHKVTLVSKYLAMILFIVMPFIGGWIGYVYAPERIVEVEKTIYLEDDAEVREFIQMYDDYHVLLNGNVYVINELPMSAPVLSLVEGVDVDSFEGLSFGYSKDKNGFYYLGKKFLEKNQDFRVNWFNVYDFWKWPENSVLLGITSSHVYYKDQPLDGINPNNFLVGDRGEYIKDEDTIYFRVDKCNAYASHYRKGTFDEQFVPGC